LKKTSSLTDKIWS